MPRSSRLVAVGHPHHITQRGNNRETVFFDDEDRWSYLNLLRNFTKKYQVDIWAYCLMSNHIHLLVVPHGPEGLAKGIGLANMTYTQFVNRKYQRSGRVWQNRFFSSVVETDQYLWAVARYIENNPVVAGIASTANEYVWSSARRHIQGISDPILKEPSWLAESARNAYSTFHAEDGKQMALIIRQAVRSNRPLGTLPVVSPIRACALNEC